MATKKKQVRQQRPKIDKAQAQRNAEVQKKLDVLMLRRVSTRFPQDLNREDENNKE